MRASRSAYPRRSISASNSRNSPSWRLCVASKDFGGAGVKGAYKTIWEGLRSIGGSILDLGDIKASGTEDHFVKDALAFQSKRGERGGFILRSHRFGDIDVENAYFYSRSKDEGGPSAPVEGPSPEVKLTFKLASLIASGLEELKGTEAPPVVTLRDGTSFRGIPLTLSNKGEESGSRVTFLDFAGHLERSFNLSEVKDIVVSANTSSLRTV